MEEKRYIVFGLGETGQEKIKFVSPAHVLVDGQTYPLPLTILHGTKEELRARVMGMIDTFFDLSDQDPIKAN